MNTENQDKDKARKVPTWKQLREAAAIFVYIRPYRWHLAGGLIMLFLSSVVFMVFPYLAGLMVDVAQGTTTWELSLIEVGWALLIILVLQGIVSYARVLLFAVSSENGIADVRKAVYEKLVTLPIVFFEQNRVGDLVSRISADVEKLYGVFSVTMAEFIRQIIILIAGIIFLAITTPRLALIMLATFPVIVVGAMIFGRYIRRLSKERQKLLADSNTILSETAGSIQAVKAFTNELFEVGRYRTTMKKVVSRSMSYARGRAVFSVFIISILFGALFFIVWQGAYMVSTGSITAGQLVAFVSYTAIIGGAIAGLGSFYAEILGAIGATERIMEILREEPEQENLHPHKNLITDGRIHGAIRFDGIRFRYPSRPDIEVLKDLSFTINPGERIALVGQSGAGKSTVMQLLLRFYTGYEGNISLDGKNIQDYDLAYYRSNMAIVPQEVMLFGGSIRENILYGKPDATEEEVIEAAKKANALDFIRSFPEGLDTLVGERGIKLSGGQKQRIAIARAILKDPVILLLDEATSSLDAESEKNVQDALNNLMEGRTSLIIAHRLATVREANKILVIEQGKIIEAGTHAELSAMEHGAYSHLAKLQFETGALSESA